MKKKLMLLVLSSIALIGCGQAKTKNDNPVNDTINEANNNNSNENSESNNNETTIEDNNGGLVTPPNGGENNNNSNNEGNNNNNNTNEENSNNSNNDVENNNNTSTNTGENGNTNEGENNNPGNNTNVENNNSNNNEENNENNQTEEDGVVTYSNNKVLEVIERKYGVVSYIFTDEEYSKTNGKYGSEIVDGDNIDAVFSSYAGEKRDGFDCYIALGRCNDETYKYFYYNTTLKKNDDIAKTVGASKYALSVAPDEVDDALFDTDEYWPFSGKVRLSALKGGNYTSYQYDRTKLTRVVTYSASNSLLVEFYKEDNNVVYDAYDLEENNKKLMFSTSNKYGTISKLSNKNGYLNIELEFTANGSSTTLHGRVSPNNVPSKVIYSKVSLTFTYLTNYENTETTLSISKSARFYTLYDSFVFDKEFVTLDKYPIDTYREHCSFEADLIYILYEK